MIQELLGGSGLLGGGDRKFSFHGTILEGIPSSSSPSPSLSPSPSASTTTATNTHTTLTTTPPPLENLRCPRCDSPNTKFCYYNNYNLTQPRHFCKTCRRYWTKGGALRNVPIGGGCRKNKSTIVSAASGKSTAGKGKIVSSEFIKANVVNGLDIHEQSNNTVLWGSPQNSQLLSLLRGNPITNPNPNSSALPNFVQFKDEGHMIGSHVQSESAAVTGTVNARTLGLDPFGQSPIGLYASLFRNNQHQPQQHQNQSLSVHGDGQNAGLQELYQRLRSSINYQPDHSFSTLTNVGTSMTTSSSSMMESVPATSGAEFGSWNPPFSWSDQSTTSNGAFP